VHGKAAKQAGAAVGGPVGLPYPAVGVGYEVVEDGPRGGGLLDAI
jgi:hypothetical protein